MTSTTLSERKNGFCIDKVDEGITDIAVVGEIDAKVHEVVISQTSLVKNRFEGGLLHVSCEHAKSRG